MVIKVPILGGLVETGLNNQGAGATADVVGQNITWTNFDMGGSHPLLGKIQITLDPARTSTGTLDSPTFPSTGTMHFFWKVQADNLKLGTMVSDASVDLVGTVDAMPPQHPHYTLVSPVAFYKQGDASHTTVMTIERGELNPSDLVPALSPWGIWTVVLLLMGGILFLLRRRIGAMYRPAGA